MSILEDKIIDIIKKYFWVIVIMVGLIGGLSARSKGLYLVSDDWNEYLLPWMTTLYENTGFKGLALDIGNYYIPYMTLLAIGTYLDPQYWLLYVKAISIFFEIVFCITSALVGKKLLKENGGDERWASAIFTILMLSPMVVVDGAFWAQCDYIYSAFAMLCIYFFINERYILAMNMLGLAYGFKQQALILLPIIILVWICNRNFSIWKLIFVPLWYYICGLPAIIAGRPAENVYTIYKRQGNAFGQLSMNLPNIYRYFPNQNKDDFFIWGLFATAAILLVLAYWLVEKNYKLSNSAILGLCMCSSGICGMFLPALHERYIALYVGFAYIYFLVFDKKKTVLAGILDTLVCITYFGFLYEGASHVAEYHYVAIVHLLILFYIIHEVVVMIKNTSASCT